MSRFTLRVSSLQTNKCSAQSRGNLEALCSRLTGVSIRLHSIARLSPCLDWACSRAPRYETLGNSICDPLCLRSDAVGISTRRRLIRIKLQKLLYTRACDTTVHIVVYIATKSHDLVASDKWFSPYA